ncbi:MAG: hypothetical protein IPP88_04900 [Betaproteobacteria bacterium]|nr:hypothetical protein [Betaproteobacteria bacterium]
MSAEIIAELKQLKLNGMASCYPELVAKSATDSNQFMKQRREASGWCLGWSPDGRGFRHGLLQSKCNAPATFGRSVPAIQGWVLSRER